MAEDTSFFGSIGNAFSGALGKAKESVSGATEGLSKAVGLNAADTNADPAAVNTTAPPLTNGGRRRRVRKTKKGSSRRRRHSRRKISRSNK